jgi:hypothetical protein
MQYTQEERKTIIMQAYKRGLQAGLMIAGVITVIAITIIIIK